MDQKLEKEEYLGLHPLDNTETWEISYKGFIEGFMKGILNREIVIVDVEKEDAPVAQASKGNEK